MLQIDVESLIGQEATADADSSRGVRRKREDGEAIPTGTGGGKANDILRQTAKTAVASSKLTIALSREVAVIKGSLSLFAMLPDIHILAKFLMNVKVNHAKETDGKKSHGLGTLSQNLIKAFTAFIFHQAEKGVAILAAERELRQEAKSICGDPKLQGIVMSKAFVGPVDKKSEHAGKTKVEFQLAFSSLAMRLREPVQAYLLAQENAVVKFDGPPRRPLERIAAEESQALEKLLKK